MIKTQQMLKLEYRIGVNMGDVVKEGDNLLGDGVNIAARLEALAQPGGITISKNVYDLVANKTKYEFNDLGIQKVKQNQFHAYDLLLDPSQKRKLKTQSSNTKINSHDRRCHSCCLHRTVLLRCVGYRN